MIKTKRLELKRIEISDGQKVLDFYIRNKDFLTPYEPAKSPSFYTLSYQENAIKAELIKEEMGKSIKFFIFLKNMPSQIIGMVTLNEIIKGCFLSCFLGYKMDYYYINQGYMTEALKEVVEYAFQEMKLHRIEANIMPKNLPSIQVCSKLGFVNEGLSRKYLKINEVWEDHLHMVLINDGLMQWL